MTAAEQKELRLFAVKVREGILRSTHAAKSGHPGGSLSSTEYFTYLYNKELCTLKGTCRPWSLCNTCQSRLFSRGRTPDSSPYWVASAGTPEYEPHAGRGYVYRLIGPGNFDSGWHG